AALGWLALDSIERRRLTRPRRIIPARPGGVLHVAAAHFLAAATAMAGLAVYERVLWELVTSTSLDVLHFSLHPASTARLAVAFTAAAASAIVLGRLSGRLHRLSQAARLGVFFVALVLPALALYPSLYADATDVKERMVVNAYAPQTLSQRDDLQRRLQQTVEQIDQVPALADFVLSRDSETPTTDRAFIVWSQTDLARYRLTSAIDLYDADGRLVSPFALHLPEYTTARFRASGCGTWEQPFDEVSKFGSSERHVLRTSRGICVNGRFAGSIVVRVMLDYQTLPFISSQSPS